MILTTADKAGELSQDPSIRIRLLGFGLSRTELAFMPEATIPAAKQALEMANLKITQN